jgi:hypothetical protein
MELLQELSFVRPAFIAGLLSRGLGVALIVMFGSLYPQLVPMAGRRGLTPIDAALRAIERDFPTPKRFVYFPSLLWLNASDFALRSVGALGLCSAALIVVGGPVTPYLFALCWIALLSLDRPMTLIYPWDAVMFEAAFWGMFLPSTAFASGIAADSGCQPAVLWAYRLLVFRVMVGFGKHKFVGTTPQDRGFLKGFLVTMPLPTRLGWLAQKLPMGVMKLGLFGMFLVEIPLPFGVFFPGPWSAVFGVATIGLMLAIWLSGNFGIFNLAMCVIALACFDSQTASQLQLFAAGGSPRALVIDALFVLHSGLAALAFPFNTFCSHSWMMWSPWLRVTPRFLCWPVDLARALHPFRFAHAYGVFSPRSGPAARVTAVAEASWDNETWHELVHPFWPTHARSVPKFCAPHHERFDQAVVYESVGMNESSPYRNIIGRWDPYGHGGVSSARMLMHRVLLGDLPGSHFYDRSRERAFGPALAVRVRSCILEPAPVAELRQSGSWWRRTWIGPHYAALRKDEGYWDEPLPEPELWHYDDLVWLKRSRMGELLQRAAAGQDADTLVRADATTAPTLTDTDIAQFWDAFVPLVHARHHASFAGLRASVSELRARYGHATLRRFERIANRYALCLFAKLEPAFLKSGWAFLKEDWRSAGGLLPVRSYYELRTLCMAILAEGRETYRAVMANPQLAAAHAERLSMFAAHQLQAVFRYETFVFHAGKLRLLDNLSRQAGRPAPNEKQRVQQARMAALAGNCWGSVPFIEFLKTQFLGPEDVLDVPEQWPSFEVTDSREVRRVPVQAAHERRDSLHTSLTSD